MYIDTSSCVFFTLLGQFWNIPVELEEFTGPIPPNDTLRYYTVSVTPPDGEVRSFVGHLYDVTWDFIPVPMVGLWLNLTILTILLLKETMLNIKFLIFSARNLHMSSLMNLGVTKSISRAGSLILL